MGTVYSMKKGNYFNIYNIWTIIKKSLENVYKHVTVDINYL